MLPSHRDGRTQPSPNTAGGKPRAFACPRRDASLQSRLDSSLFPLLFFFPPSLIYAAPPLPEYSDHTETTRKMTSVAAVQREPPKQGQRNAMLSYSFLFSFFKKETCL